MMSILKTNMSTMKVLIFVVLSACMVLVVLKLRCTDDHARWIASTGSATDLDFVPAAPNRLSDCDELFGPDTAASAFQLSAEFHAGFAAFDAAVNESVIAEGGYYEGNSFGMATQFKLMHYLASRPNVRSICETGFNLGHSSFNYLTANRHAIVHTFDIGFHQYAHTMATFLLARFPGRLFVHFGDSTQTVPAFARENPNHRCDFLYVDGGHTYPVAMADLLNFAAMADLDAGNIIMFDDYPALAWYSRPIGWAWENMCRWGYVRELMRCSHAKSEYKRGFVIGIVVRRPHLSF